MLRPRSHRDSFGLVRAQAGAGENDVLEVESREGAAERQWRLMSMLRLSAKEITFLDGTVLDSLANR